MLNVMLSCSQTLATAFLYSKACSLTCPPALQLPVNQNLVLHLLSGLTAIFALYTQRNWLGSKDEGSDPFVLLYCTCCFCRGLLRSIQQLACG